VQPRPVEAPTDYGAVLHFATLGPLVGDPPDGRLSPVVTLYAPRRRRGVLWTAGEVHFLTANCRERFPALHAVSRRFRSWLRGFECVFEQKPGARGDWNYYLEGSLQNYDSSIYALPSAMDALRRGQYFVGDDDNELVLDTICKSLHLRGVEGITAEP
jgi:hypothetical protein